MVVGNIVGGSELGFESDENEVVLVAAHGRIHRFAARLEACHRRPHFR